MNVVWFRTDLRIEDNLALEAARHRGEVIALYIATPDQWQTHNDAPIKLDFWRRNLVELEKALSRLKIPLVCAQAPDYPGSIEIISSALSVWQADSLHLNADYPLNEVRRDHRVLSAARELGVEAVIHHDQILIEPGSVLNNSGEPFKVFTPFSKKCRVMLQLPVRAEKIWPNSSLGVPGAIKGQKPLEELGWPAPESRWTDLWPAGEKAAREKLKHFCIQPVAGYKQNRDFPALPGTSTLSPWLTSGVISIRDCWREATLSHSGEGPETWKNELLWREFYKHIIFHYPHVNMNKAFRQELDSLPWRYDEKDFKAWCEGQTGIPIVDAAMRQLKETGWMHNRLRMITAMFLSKNLLLDWRWGEKWFMEHLVDGDFSANNGGWQWSSSTGTDAAPYFRIFNPITQSQRFDAQGEFIRYFVPELSELDEKSIHDPGMLKPAEYPLPIVDLKMSRQRALAAFKSNKF